MKPEPSNNTGCESAAAAGPAAPVHGMDDILRLQNRMITESIAYQQADGPADAQESRTPSGGAGEQQQEEASDFADEALEKLERLYFTSPFDKTSVAVCDIICAACDEIRQIIESRNEARERGIAAAKCGADVPNSAPPDEGRSTGSGANGGANG